eukprot:scaffold3178_cov282-Pinguiococcus_pyrenoidosus.AAC.8
MVDAAEVLIVRLEADADGVNSHLIPNGLAGPSGVPVACGALCLFVPQRVGSHQEDHAAAEGSGRHQSDSYGCPQRQRPRVDAVPRLASLRFTSEENAHDVQLRIPELKAIGLVDAEVEVAWRRQERLFHIRHDHHLRRSRVALQPAEHRDLLLLEAQNLQGESVRFFRGRHGVHGGAEAGDCRGDQPQSSRTGAAVQHHRDHVRRRVLGAVLIRYDVFIAGSRELGALQEVLSSDERKCS